MPAGRRGARGRARRRVGAKRIRRARGVRARRTVAVEAADAVVDALVESLIGGFPRTHRQRQAKRIVTIPSTSVPPPLLVRLRPSSMGAQGRTSRPVSAVRLRRWTRRRRHTCSVRQRTSNAGVGESLGDGRRLRSVSSVDRRRSRVCRKHADNVLACSWRQRRRWRELTALSQCRGCQTSSTTSVPPGASEGGPRPTELSHEGVAVAFHGVVATDVSLVARHASVTEGCIQEELGMVIASGEGGFLWTSWCLETPWCSSS